MISNESIIIQRAQNGEPLAFAHLHDAYFPVIYRFFFYRMRDPKDAKWLSSDLFAKVVEKIGLYKPGEMTFINWLYLLANQLMTTYTLERDSLSIPTSSVIQSTPKPDSQPLRTACLKTSLALLSPDEREVIISKLIERKSLRSVAREINRSLITVRSLQHIALLNLTGALQEENCLDEA